MRSLSAGLKFQNPQIFDIVVVPDKLKEGVKLLFYDLAVIGHVFVIGQAELRFEVVG